jgi:hypothetical protein
MAHLPFAHHETSKRDSPNDTKIKEKQNKPIPDLNSNLAKSMTYHNQTKKLTAWFLRPAMLDNIGGVPFHLLNAKNIHMPPNHGIDYLLKLTRKRPYISGTYMHSTRLG